MTDEKRFACGNCGNTFNEKDRFCRICGTSRENGKEVFSPRKNYDSTTCVYGPLIRVKYTCSSCNHTWEDVGVGLLTENHNCPECGSNALSYNSDMKHPFGSVNQIHTPIATDSISKTKTLSDLLPSVKNTSNSYGNNTSSISTTLTDSYSVSNNNMTTTSITENNELYSLINKQNQLIEGMLHEMQEIRKGVYKMHEEIKHLQSNKQEN